MAQPPDAAGDTTAEARPAADHPDAVGVTLRPGVNVPVGGPSDGDVLGNLWTSALSTATSEPNTSPSPDDAPTGAGLGTPTATPVPAVPAGPEEDVADAAGTGSPGRVGGGGKPGDGSEGSRPAVAGVDNDGTHVGGGHGGHGTGDAADASGGVKVADVKLDTKEAVAPEPSAGSTHSGDGESKDDEVMEWSPERRFARFATKMGEGAFKVVYKGEDRENGIEVAWNAIRINSYSSQDKQRILDEVRMLRTLRHDKLLKFYGSWFNKEEKCVVFITELFHAGTLKQFVNRYPISMASIKKILKQILDCLKYLHTPEDGRGPVIHRDLKCDNIFIDGTDGSIKIGDLGLSTALERETGQATSVLGTPEFMAPEMYGEAYNSGVDIYAFGMCALEMLTRRPPYSECRTVAEVMRKVTNGAIPDSLATLKDGQFDDAYHFIFKLIVADGSKRPSAEELESDPFLVVTEDDLSRISGGQEDADMGGDADGDEGPAVTAVDMGSDAGDGNASSSIPNDRPANDSMVETGDEGTERDDYDDADRGGERIAVSDSRPKSPLSTRGSGADGDGDREGDGDGDGYRRTAAESTGTQSTVGSREPSSFASAEDPKSGHVRHDSQFLDDDAGTDLDDRDGEARGSSGAHDPRRRESDVDNGDQEEEGSDIGSESVHSYESGSDRQRHPTDRDVDDDGASHGVRSENEGDLPDRPHSALRRRDLEGVRDMDDGLRESGHSLDDDDASVHRGGRGSRASQGDDDATSDDGDDGDDGDMDEPLSGDEDEGEYDEQEEENDALLIEVRSSKSTMVQELREAVDTLRRENYDLKYCINEEREARRLQGLAIQRELDGLREMNHTLLQRIDQLIHMQKSSTAAAPDAPAP